MNELASVFLPDGSDTRISVIDRGERFGELRFVCVFHVIGAATWDQSEYFPTYKLSLECLVNRVQIYMEEIL